MIKAFKIKKAACMLLLVFFVIVKTAASGFAQSSVKTSMKHLIDRNLHSAVDQYLVLAKKIPSDSLARGYDPARQKNIYSGASWWCSGFYPGALLLLYEATNNQELKKEAVKKLTVIKNQMYNTSDHDLGFKMNCSFGNAYRIFKDTAYKNILIVSANSLATRYKPTIKSIKSWDFNTAFKCPVIIDNMMNLELLEWAGHNGGGERLKEIAINHANTTLKNHFRPDYSSYHVVDYDLNTGLPMRKATWQGVNDSSAWARGQAWGLYGFTMMYRETKNPVYLNQAKSIAKFILNNPNLPVDLIPYWDFNAPDIPNALKDASAAAVISSALLELAQYTQLPEKRAYIKAAETILRSLSSNTYQAAPGTNGGFILKHSVGAFPMHEEVDVSLSYADYYYIEALTRYKKWYL
jgi:unsaturated chondroitin disaccharide hydrolase